MKVPFVDLQAQYQTIKSEIDKAIQQVIEDMDFVGGKYPKKFEEEFARFLGINHFISCGNGTDSIEILLKSMNIGVGDEVIVPAFSWISTSEAVSNVGAKPIFVDIENDFYCINPLLIEEKITSKTKAIIPVHFYGQPANMPLIMQIAKKYQLKVLEDCAQAHGAMIDNKMVGTWGDAASFSFYPGKNLGAYGDAGGMATNNIDIAEKARRIANHGQLNKHDHLFEGRNSRLDSLQASVLLTKLPYLFEWTEKRIKNAQFYNNLLKNIVEIPQLRPNSKHVFHLYVIRTQNRDELQRQLLEKEIQTSVHYPKALPFLPCYVKNNNFPEKKFPVSFQFQKEILSLPMFAELSKEQIDYVADKIIKIKQ
ncbi:MAG: DegT/DnrJ/EryC1/StrS family aminotransferase [Bacteroidetes bacterium]|nr:MAG: DegT/DnrJ/EryC1/StrS family aminotransferase [Bacteroidota bacterium]